VVNGTVKWFNSKKGYGFITPKEEGAKDVFVHFSAITAEGDKFRTLNEGDEVEFTVVDGQKGQEARDVKVTKAAPVQPRSPRPRPFRSQY
jgi:CspA family cold shock protein